MEACPATWLAHVPASQSWNHLLLDRFFGVCAFPAQWLSPLSVVFGTNLFVIFTDKTEMKLGFETQKRAHAPATQAQKRGKLPDSGHELPDAGRQTPSGNELPDAAGQMLEHVFLGTARYDCSATNLNSQNWRSRTFYHCASWG